MKTKLSLLLTTFAFSGIASIATAGPGLQEFALRKQIADAQRTSTVVVADAGPVRYVANSSGKGGTVTTVRNGAATNIALFKSAKADDCGAAVCCTSKH
jgi:hypothetical protein